MLRVKNHSGEELINLHDDGEEEFVDQKLKEDAKKAKKKVEKEIDRVNQKGE